MDVVNGYYPCSLEMFIDYPMDIYQSICCTVTFNQDRKLQIYKPKGYQELLLIIKLYFSYKKPQEN